MKNTLVSVSNISFAYGDEIVLSDINFEIDQGDYFGIIGPNGGGKTTLLKIMLGLIRPTNGEVKLFGIQVQKFKDWSRLGYVPQKAVHFDAAFPATVKEIVAMGRYGKLGLFHGLSISDHEIILNALHQVDMLDYQDRLIGELSGGQQQRVLIARALAGQPEILFLDEPTVGVDVKTQDQFYELLKKLNRELGLTLVLISHDIDVISNETTKLACINQSLVYHGIPSTFLKEDYFKNLYGKDVKFILHGH